MVKKRIIGYDISKKYVQISYWENGMSEPDSLFFSNISSNAGIPFRLAYNKDDSSFTIREIINSDLYIIDDLLNKALNDETIILDKEYKAEDLLKEFFAQSISRLYNFGEDNSEVYISFTLDKVDDVVNLIFKITSDLGIPRNRIFIQDYKESYYDYLCSKPKDTWRYGSILYEVRNNRFYSCKVKKTRLIGNRKKELVLIEDKMSSAMPIGFNKDKFFKEFIAETIGKDIITSVFLIGKEFEGDWFPESLEHICLGRRVFGGSNLYSRGACYGGMRKTDITSYDELYIDTHKISYDIDILLKNKGNKEWYSIAKQGENWYEINKEIEVILDQTTHFDIRMVDINNKIKEEKIILDGLFERQRRSTRLRIGIFFVSKFMGKIVIKDVDFGDIMKSRDYYLEHFIQLEDEN